MNTKIMEGLAGASTSMNLLNTPMRVYKEARLKGDTATMERAAGYVGDFAGRAEEYKTEAYKGMEEDAREARKKAEEERMEIREARKKAEEERMEIREADNIQDGNTSPDGKVPEGTENSIARTEQPVIYTNTGEKQPEQDTVTSISLSV